MTTSSVLSFSTNLTTLMKYLINSLMFNTPAF
jgi:hypothetical protein